MGEVLVAEGLLEKNDAVVVGVSGGSDSVALLHLLCELNANEGWRLAIHVAHLDHQIRGDESQVDAAFVLALSDDLSLPCTLDTLNVPALCADRSGSVEEIARRERYAFFERVCLKVGAKFVAVAHHADDNAETILHRILRGTGLRGLVGIPFHRSLGPGSQIQVIRPLLRHTRAEITTYLADSGIAYREDRSNQSTEPMRNRIRNKILPILASEVNPQVREALVRLGEQARWVDEYLQETVHRTFETLIISRTDQTLFLNAQAVARKSRIVQTELVRLAYRSFGLGEQDLGFSHMAAVLRLIADSGSGKQLKFPGGMTIEKRYHQLIFSLPSDEPRETISPEIAVHLPGKTTLPIRRLVIECEVRDVSGSQIDGLRRQASRMEEYIDLDAVHPPLVVRTRRAGERFIPLGAPGSKKLSDFLIDLKVDPKERERVAVLCDQLGPIWIIGFRIDDRVKLTALTRRALHLVAQPWKP